MRTPEIIELSSSSLRGGLHDCLITYVALMCKLSMYPSYISMCSTGKISSEMEEHLRCK
ncbi:Bis(5'-nucleosyl)-tetraphosphatase, symmetrical [Gossypium arboreum]|uniref:Bis(5'-nucleosyl)-tetraphosphatase, symmetrical n=1 Tax=Gossypium arboreum TaxID=29729 RepID=A0A0B0MFY4_GOSAR|nr:Bis(5'-nucleosyl)-tetraphosphatase, symmetrical [Gossypium arboreum]